MIRVILNFVAFGMAQTDLRFPLSTDSHGDLVMNVSVPSVGIGPISAIVNMGSINTMLYTGPMAMGGRMEIQSPTGDATYIWDDESMLITNVGRYSVLTIGPQSELTRSVGSVAIIRRSNGSELVIRSTLDRFNETCTPGSLMQIQFGSNNRVIGSFSSSEEPPRSLGSVEWHIVEDRHLFVPVGVIEDILVAMMSRGARFVDDTYLFNNCSAEMVEGLPNINLFVQTTNGQISRVVLFPDEYVKTSGGSCRLRLMRQTTEASRFNPLQIPNLNVRISSNHVVEICDSRE